MPCERHSKPPTSLSKTPSLVPAHSAVAAASNSNDCRKLPPVKSELDGGGAGASKARSSVAIASARDCRREWTRGVSVRSALDGGGAGASKARARLPLPVTDQGLQVTWERVTSKLLANNAFTAPPRSNPGQSPVTPGQSTHRREGNRRLCHLLHQAVLATAEKDEPPQKIRDLGAARLCCIHEERARERLLNQVRACARSKLGQEEGVHIIHWKPLLLAKCHWRHPRTSHW